jgi:hypothetical protein
VLKDPIHRLNRFMYLYHFITLSVSILLTMSIGAVNGFGVEVRRNLSNYYIGNSSMRTDDNSRPRRRNSYDSSFPDGASSTVADSKNSTHFLYERLCKFNKH